MKLSKTFTINAPIDKVWHELADNFEGVGAWSRVVPESKAIPGSSDFDQLGHATGRVCATPLGSDVTEQINHYDPGDDKQKQIGWRVTNLPSIMEYADNLATLTAKGMAETVVIFDMDVKMRTWGIPAIVFMKPYMSRMIGTVAIDLTHYIETGEPSPAKMKQLQKQQAAAGA